MKCKGWFVLLWHMGTCSHIVCLSVGRCGKCGSAWNSAGDEWLIVFVYVSVIASKRALLHEVRLDNDSVILNTICQGYWFKACARSADASCVGRETARRVRDTTSEALFYHLWGCFTVCTEEGSSNISQDFSSVWHCVSYCGRPLCTGGRAVGPVGAAAFYRENPPNLASCLSGGRRFSEQFALRWSITWILQGTYSCGGSLTYYFCLKELPSRLFSPSRHFF